MSFGLANAPAVIMDPMNGASKPYLDIFVIVNIDDILIYSKRDAEHANYVRLFFRLLRIEGYMPNFKL